MCVIIIKNPNVTIPKDKIASACIVNPDGFGISIIKDGELLSFRNYDSKGNDPEEIYRLMMEYHSLPQFILFRFTTKGAKVLENCHPFRLIETEGYALDLMHNGTLYDFGPKAKDDRSDTRIFAEEFATPLAEAFFARNGNTMQSDPVYQQIMEKYSGNGFLVTYDNLGNYYVAGGKGEQYQGWWASNAYSFNRAHREPAKTTYYNKNYNGYSSSAFGEDDYSMDGGGPSEPPWGHKYKRGDGVQMEWSYALSKYIEVSERKEATVPQLPVVPLLPPPSSSAGASAAAPASAGEVVGRDVVNDNERDSEEEEEAADDEPVSFRKLFDAEETSYQTKLLGYALAEAKRKRLTFADHVPPTRRTTFLELSGLTTLEDCCLLDVDEIEDMVNELPEAAALLIMDLLHELYTSRRAEKRVAA